MGNGFDINNFGSMISNLGKATAGMQNNESEIDTKSELNAYVSGWDAIKAAAEKQGAKDVDITSLEGDMKTELAGLLGAEFGQKAKVAKNEKAAFSAEEISLENDGITYCLCEDGELHTRFVALDNSAFK